MNLDRIKIPTLNQKITCDTMRDLPIFEFTDPRIYIPNNHLEEYIIDLIRWFRSVGWSYEQCKHALDEGLKVLK